MRVVRTFANTDFGFSRSGATRRNSHCTGSASNKRMGTRGPRYLRPHRVVLEVDEDNEEVTSLVARHISGAQGNHQRRTKAHPSGLVRLFQAIGTGAPERKSANGFTNSWTTRTAEAEKGMATSRRQGRIAGPDYPSRGLV